MSVTYAKTNDLFHFMYWDLPRMQMGRTKGSEKYLEMGTNGHYMYVGEDKSFVVAVFLGYKILCSLFLMFQKK